MRVTVKGIGDLRDYFGKMPHDVTLPESACLRDLLLRIEQDWGASLPAYFWDFETHLFRGPVALVLNKMALRPASKRLRKRPTANSWAAQVMRFSCCMINPLLTSGGVGFINLGETAGGNRDT